MFPQKPDNSASRIITPEEPITSKEWYVLNDIIADIYKSSDTHQARRVVLDRVGELIRFDKGSFMLASVRDGILDYFDPVLKNDNIDHMTEYLRDYQHLDPMVSFYTQGDEMVYIDSEYVSPAMAKSSILYRDWFWGNGMYFMLGAKLVYNDILLGSMLLSRPENDVDFLPHDKEILRVLAEHLSFRIHVMYPNGVTKEAIEMGGDPLAVKYNLSFREMEVLELLCRGYTSKELAEELCISENTVKRHAGSIYKKVGVSGKPQLMAVIGQEQMGR